MKLNKWQKRIKPGTPEAKAARCSCTGETYALTNADTGETTESFLYDADCPLHGLEKPENRVPETW